MTVIEKESRQPIEGAFVRVGPHRGSTDECGVAKVRVPAGTFDVGAWTVGYLPPSATVDVAADVSVQLEAEIREDRPSPFRTTGTPPGIAGVEAGTELLKPIVIEPGPWKK